MDGAINFDLQSPVGQVAFMYPRSVRIMQELGIDLSMESQRPFEDACQMRNLCPRRVRARVGLRPPVPNGVSWDDLRAALGR